MYYDVVVLSICMKKRGCEYYLLRKSYYQFGTSVSVIDLWNTPIVYVFSDTNNEKSNNNDPGIYFNQA